MNITLSADKEIIEKVRKFARDHNTTLNQLIRDYMTKLVMEEYAQNASERFLRICDQTTGDSGGWQWNRAELYEE